MTGRASLGQAYWSMVLISIGAVLALRTAGYQAPIWEGLSEYWPLLIVGWGLIKLLDYYRVRGPGRAILSAGEVAMMVLVIVAGAALTTAVRIGSDLAFIGLVGEEIDLFDVIGESFEFTETIEADAEPGSRIEIHNIYGSIEVEPGGDNAIAVDVTRRIRALDREEAERLEPQMDFAIEESDGRYVIQSNRDELSRSQSRRFRSSLRLRVPQMSTVDIDNKYGTVKIVGLTGDQVVQNQFGGTIVRDIAGDVRIKDGYGAVTAEDISGDIAVTNEFASVMLTVVGGNVIVGNQFGGIHLSDIEGDITVQNRFSEVTANRVSGRLRIEGTHDSIHLEDSGAVEIYTTYGDIDPQSLAGAFDARNRHGLIRLSFSQPPRDDIAIAGDDTDVRVDLPADSEFMLDARTGGGSIDSDFSGMDTIRTGAGQQVVARTASPGPVIRIEIRRGDVRIARRR